MTHKGAAADAGHYMAYVKKSVFHPVSYKKDEKAGLDEDDDDWYKFDDDKVTKATMREVFEDAFGGEYKTTLVQQRAAIQRKQPMMRQMNAYMLVYIRECLHDEVLPPFREEDTPAHLSASFGSGRGAYAPFLISCFAQSDVLTRSASSSSTRSSAAAARSGTPQTYTGTARS